MHSRGNSVMLRILAMVLVCYGALSVSAFGGDAASGIEARGAWVRWLPANMPAAGYVTLVNTGPTAVELVGTSSADYGEVGMHQTIDDHGMSEMRPVASLVLKPHATVAFAEGGYHLMLMQPTRSVHPGDRVNIVFRFSDGKVMTVPFEVRSPTQP